MVKQLRILRKRPSRALAADPGRFAGGSAMDDPLGLLAVEQEDLTRLPIGRVVGPADVAALAVHLMTNTAITGATFDIDGGQQLIAA